MEETIGGIHEDNIYNLQGNKNIFVLTKIMKLKVKKESLKRLQERVINCNYYDLIEIDELEKCIGSLDKYEFYNSLSKIKVNEFKMIYRFIHPSLPLFITFEDARDVLDYYETASKNYQLYRQLAKEIVQEEIDYRLFLLKKIKNNFF